MNDPGAVPTDWHEYRGKWVLQHGEVIAEAAITIYVNGVELATIMATPRQQDLLALKMTLGLDWRVTRQAGVQILTAATGW